MPQPRRTACVLGPKPKYFWLRLWFFQNSTFEISFPIFVFYALSKLLSDCLCYGNSASARTLGPRPNIILWLGILIPRREGHIASGFQPASAAQYYQTATSIFLTYEDRRPLMEKNVTLGSLSQFWLGILDPQSPREFPWSGSFVSQSVTLQASRYFARGSKNVSKAFFIAMGHH